MQSYIKELYGAAISGEIFPKRKSNLAEYPSRLKLRSGSLGHPIHERGFIKDIKAIER